MPEISVVIPTYNRPDALRRAIKSVLEQTYGNYELIVVDDGSSDDIETVVSDVDDANIEFIQFNENQGANAARNAGIRSSNGKYISFLDSDDELHPQYLERVIQTTESTPPSCGGGFSAFQLVESGRVTNISPAPNGEVTEEEILADNVVGGFSCLTVKAEVFDVLDFLDEEMRSSQDYEFFIRLLGEFTLKGIPETLVTCHVDTADRITNNVERKVAGQRQILRKHGGKLTPAGRSRTHYVRAFAYARAGEFGMARRHFLEAIDEDPTNWLAYYHYVATLFGVRGFDGAVRIKASIKLAVYRIRSIF